MTPLRIEFNLVTPVAGMSMPLHLDALLAYAVTQEALSDAQSSGEYPKEGIRALGEHLPLQKESQGELWCWQASALIPEEVLAHEMRLWTRKTEAEMIATMTQEGSLKRLREPQFPLKMFSLKIETGRGFMKNHFQFIPVRHVRKFVAYCVGDQDRIFDLLQTHITHIGARGKTGFGRIAQDESGTIQSITVERDNAAIDLWKQRVMPWPQAGYLPIEAAHTPPYWAHENKRIGYIPANIVS